MFTIYTSANCKGEKTYIFDQIFGLFLGIPFRIDYSGVSGSFKITKEDKPGTLEINDVFFAQFEDKDRWLSKESLPRLPLKVLPKDNTPILYGNNKIEESQNYFRLGIDLVGSSFFMLSRYEELIGKERDVHGRFPALASVSYKGGFLDRPIVDEYVGILWEYILALWPDSTKTYGSFTTKVSCDVDNLHDKGVRFPGIIKRLGGDLLQRRSFKQFFNSLKLFYKVSILKKDALDPFNTFDFMMDVCENNGLKMAFYFIPGNNKLPIDGDYDIESNAILELMRNIIARGHEVGYHGSYHSYKDLGKTMEEVELLKKVYEKAGGDPNDIKGGRQHYLRWEPGITEQNWEATGLVYDATLGYAEHSGFRCGTGREFFLYNIPTRKQLKLKERPLIVMEGSLLLKKYQNLNYEEAIMIAERLKQRSYACQSNFNVLWHNSFFKDPILFNVFKRICSR